MAESHIEKAFRIMMKEEVRKLNQHLPKARKTLKALLNETTPTTESLDGRSIVIKREELEKIAKLVPLHLHEKIYFPIVIQRRFDLGKSVFMVLGNGLEEFILKHALGLAESEFNNYKTEGKFYIYKPYLAELIHIFHSLIVIGFGIPEGLELDSK